MLRWNRPSNGRVDGMTASLLREASVALRAVVAAVKDTDAAIMPEGFHGRAYAACISNMSAALCSTAARYAMLFFRDDPEGLKAWTNTFIEDMREMLELTIVRERDQLTSEQFGTIYDMRMAVENAERTENAQRPDAATS